MAVMRSRMVVPAVIVAALAGCASGPPPKPQMAVPPYAAALAAASRQVAAAWGETARQSRVFHRPPHLPALADAPVSLQQIVRVQWVGPPVPLLRSLAARAGWRFLVLGSPPPTETVVTISGHRAILSDLEQIGSQMSGSRVVVDAATHTILLDSRP